MAKTVTLTWEEIRAGVKVLVKQIKASGKKYRRVICIADGGILLGVKIAHELDLPLGVVRGIHNYQNRKLVGRQSVRSIRKDTLIIDDLIDSGTTLAKVRSDVCVFCVKSKLPSLKYFVKKVPKNVWISFPWGDGK